MSRENSYTIDAANLDTAGTIVPTDAALADTKEAFDLGTKQASVWSVEIFNNATENIDATPVITTTSDGDLTQYDTVDSLTTTVTSGGTVPDSVEIMDHDVSARKLGVELTPAAAATGTVELELQSRER